MRLRLSFACLFLLSASLLQAQQSQFLQNGAAKIHYRSFGTGQPILIINGGPGMNSDGFINLATEMGKQYRAIIYDQRGTGKSLIQPVDSTTITLDEMVKDMEALRQHLGLEKWTVMGQSFGGMLASYYATQHPQRVERLILCASGGVDLDLFNDIGQRLNDRLDQAHVDSLDFWNAAIDGGDTSHFARYHRGLALAPAYLCNLKHVPAIAERLTQSNAGVNALVWQSMQGMGFDCAAGLKAYKGPALILQGLNDILAPRIAEKSKAALPQARLVWMKNCSHYAWLDRPDVFWKEVRRFMKG